MTLLVVLCMLIDVNIMFAMNKKWYIIAFGTKISFCILGLDDEHGLKGGIKWSGYKL